MGCTRGLCNNRPVIMVPFSEYCAIDLNRTLKCKGVYGYLLLLLRKVLAFYTKAISISTRSNHKAKIINRILLLYKKVLLDDI